MTEVDGSIQINKNKRKEENGFQHNFYWNPTSRKENISTWYVMVALLI